MNAKDACKMIAQIPGWEHTTEADVWKAGIWKNQEVFSALPDGLATLEYFLFDGETMRQCEYEEFKVILWDLYSQSKENQND